MKKLIAAMIASLALTAHALPKDEDLWTYIASHASGDRFSILNKSGIITKNDNGVPVVAVKGRIVAKEGGGITPVSWYVPLESCDAGQGVLVITSPMGDYIDNTQFAFGSGTIAGIIAEVMCGAAEKMLKNKPAPSQAPQPQKKPANPNSIT
jgi:hypothetical protein